MNPDRRPNHLETRFHQPRARWLRGVENRRLTVPKPAVERPNLISAPLSIGASILISHPQDIEKYGKFFGRRAETGQALESLATFACRSGVKRIQPAASGKWGEVPIFDISRIEMTNV